MVVRFVRRHISSLLPAVIFATTLCSCGRSNISRDRTFPPDCRLDSLDCGAGTVRASDLPPDAAGVIDGVLARVVQLRGLTQFDRIEARGISRDAQTAYVRSEIESPESVASIREVEVLLKATGSIQRDADLTWIMTDFMVDGIAGYYEWNKKTLFIVDATPVGDYPDVLAHELVHALQDQHFGLARLAEPVVGVCEPSAAALAVVEGDAMLTMFALKAPGLFEGELDSSRLADALDATWDGEFSPDSVPLPPVVSEILKFPYVAGIRFVGRTVSVPGTDWRALDALLANPPLSTEQILHPQPPDRPDYPVNVRLAVTAPAGAVRVGSDILGESGFQAIFRGLMDRDKADAAAAGWDGDRYVAWSLADQSPAAVIVSVWDSSGDAIEAANAMSRTPAAPGAVLVRDRMVVGVWGLAGADAGSMVEACAVGTDTIEIRSWSDWMNEASVAVGQVSR